MQVGQLTFNENCISCHGTGGTGAKGYNWLAFYDYSFTDKVSTAFRISGEKMTSGGPSFTKYTVCPALAITANLTVRAEYSYTSYSSYKPTSSTNFFGVQALYKF